MPRQHVKKLEGRIRALGKSLSALTDDSYEKEFLRIIHKPGWTTPAEFNLVVGALDSMVSQARSLANQKRALLAGSKAVGE
jgi:hypothetical protein